MRIITAAILGFATLCHSTLAVAADTIPFSKLAGNSGVYPATPLPYAGGGQATASAPTAQPAPLTQGQKVMIGVGIAFLGVGAALMGIGAATSSKGIAGPTIRDVGLGAGAGAAGTGVVLIAFGAHHHRAK